MRTVVHGPTGGQDPAMKGRARPTVMSGRSGVPSRSVLAVLLCCSGLLRHASAGEALAAPIAEPIPVPTTAIASESMIVSLAEALRLAHHQGRDKQFQDEEIRLLAQALANVRRDYGPQFSGSVSTAVFGAVHGEHGEEQRAQVGGSQVLPTGGSLAVDTDTGQTRTSAGIARTTSLVASLRQPLLRGSGPAVWRETLTAAERGYIYAMRAHELFREDLSLTVAHTYWALLQQANALEQYRAAVERARFLQEQTRAQLTIGKSLLDEAFRADVAALNAQQQLIDAEAAYAASVDAFKFRLNVPIETEIRLLDEPAALADLELDVHAALAAAFAHRLDWLTTQDEADDARRQVALARRQLLPDLSLDASLGWNGFADDPWRDTIHDDPDYRVAVTLEIPFNRRDERLSYQRALVGVTRRERDLEAKRQSIIQDVFERARALRRAQHSRVIQDRNRTQSRNRLEKAQLDFKAGLINNRDLLEAQENVRSAETAYFAAQILYRSAELELRRDTGLLTVDADGLWANEWPPYLSAAKEAERP
jgi:outer membrane protein TolC